MVLVNMAALLVWTGVTIGVCEIRGAGAVLLVLLVRCVCVRRLGGRGEQVVFGDGSLDASGDVTSRVGPLQRRT